MIHIIEISSIGGTMVNYTPKLATVENKIHQQATRSVQDIMTESRVIIPPKMLILEAVTLILESNQSGAPVVQANGNLIGFLSEKDCLKFNLDMKYYNDCPSEVDHYMSTKLLTLSPTDSLIHVVELFLKHNFQVYPVTTHDNHFVGIVTRKQILSEICKLGQTSW